MKRICLCFFVFLFTGCGSVKNNAVVDNFSCITDDSSFDIVVSNGKIIKYIDSNDGELGQETVDIINDEHLSNVNNNDDALVIMDGVMKDLGGFCEKKED